MDNPLGISQSSSPSHGEINQDKWTLALLRAGRSTPKSMPLLALKLQCALKDSFLDSM